MFRNARKHPRPAHWPALSGLAALLCLLFAGCAASPPATTTALGQTNILEHVGHTTPTRLAVIRAAADMLGQMYQTGATGPAAFSDNGLVVYAYGHAGVRLPLAPHGLLGAGEPVSIAKAEPGDLVFYQTRAAGGPDSLRVGLFLNRSEMLYASAKQKRVVVQPINSDFWRDRLLGVVKILP